jgi:hypothetical protein
MLATLVVASSLIPERYASAKAWAADARAAIKTSSSDIATGFSSAGLAPLGSSFAIDRKTTSVLQTAGASLSVGAMTLNERWPRDTTRAQSGGDLRSFVTAGTGGGGVEAPLVFAGRGIVPNPDLPAFRPRIALQNPDLQSLLRNYPDDYAGIDVRGKVVLLVRFLGFVHQTFDANGQPKTRQIVAGYGQDESIVDAIKRGASAVVFIDTDLPFYVDAATSASPRAGPPSPFTRIERLEPATTVTGVPVVIVSAKATELVAPFGLGISTLFGADDFGKFDGTRSLSRDLGVTARVSVPLEKKETLSSSIAGEVSGVADDASRALIWTVLPAGGGSSSSIDAMTSLARVFAPRRVPFLFVAFDPSGETNANRKLVIDALGARRIGLVLVLLDLNGNALQFTTPNGDLIPAFDLYADRAGSRHVLTRSTLGPTALGDIAPLPSVRTVVIRGSGASGDLRGDAAALIGYVAGRYALGAEELPR